MGMDFSTVFSYAGPEANERAILELESATPPAVRNVLRVWLEQDFGYDPDLDRVGWVDTYDACKDMPRPALPTTAVSLKLAECFHLTFSSDAVCVYHTLRWRIFLTEPDWQTIMLDACNAFGRHLGAHEYIVTRDESPLVLSMIKGARYQEAIDHALAEGESQVEKLTDMYFEVDDRGTWDTKGFYRVRLDTR